ncbi:hypothetical protein Y032_0479g2205 [Ancylostoma ceylanicum]|uniref:Uncharacterized protein n=1 Tax=Ancylostoma ceylanicum TaxID=53326 RepID=A0A016WXQ8_9BILA|nr:hypothetical protein Y032_0479g2205 [Ancylostoma ceylanicum]
MLRLVVITQILQVENEGDDSSKSPPKSHLVYYRSPPAERMIERSNFTSGRNRAQLKLHKLIHFSKAGP